MRFKRITVENFGPFKNPTSIDFTERNGVSIVWGRNGRGKTTLLNAFNFVLIAFTSHNQLTSLFFSVLQKESTIISTLSRINC